MSTVPLQEIYRDSQYSGIGAFYSGSMKCTRRIYNHSESGDRRYSARSHDRYRGSAFIGTI